jgi:hypothetical protein
MAAAGLSLSSGTSTLSAAPCVSHACIVHTASSGGEPVACTTTAMLRHVPARLRVACRAMYLQSPCISCWHNYVCAGRLYNKLFVSNGYQVRWLWQCHQCPPDAYAFFLKACTSRVQEPGGTWKKVPGPHRQKLHPGALDPPPPPLPPWKSPSRC